MRSLTLVLLSAASPLFLLPVAQGPQPAAPQTPSSPPPVPPELQVTPSPGAHKEILRTAKAMQGLWTLREFAWPHLDGVSSEFRGYCLVSDNHVSFEVHIGLRDSQQRPKDVLLDSGIWRFDVVEGGRMILTSLIGSYIDQKNRVEFREAGTQCRYEITARGEQMIWSKEDGQRLVFVRLTDFGPKRVDAFGRTIPEKKDEESKVEGAKGGGTEKQPPDGDH